jgi:hypothetical protein
MQRGCSVQMWGTPMFLSFFCNQAFRNHITAAVACLRFRVLRKHGEVVTHLGCLPLSPLQVVDPVAAAQPAARSKDLMRAMKEAAQGIGMRGGREVSSSSSSSSLPASGHVSAAGSGLVGFLLLPRAFTITLLAPYSAPCHVHVAAHHALVFF